MPDTSVNSTAVFVSWWEAGRTPPVHVKVLPKCGVCGKRTVAFEFQRCNVCTNRRRR